MAFRDIAQNNIFPGESGGDYDALYGYSGREGGQFAGVRPTQMTINQMLEFQDPNGPYGQWVKQQNNGTVSTPSGAYQVVGRTLRGARDALGLTGDEMYSPAMQDRIGEHIYNTQGSGAWEGWGGTGGGQMATQNANNYGGGMMPPPPEEKRNPTMSDWAARMAPAFGRMGVMGLEEPAQRALDARNEKQGGEQARNRTAQWLSQQGRDDLAQAVMAGALSGSQAASIAYAQPKDNSTSAMRNFEALIAQGVDRAKARDMAFGGGGNIDIDLGSGGQTAGWEAVDKAYAETWLRDSTSGLADVSSQTATIASVLGQLEAGEDLTGIGVGIQGDFVRSIMNPNAQDAKDRVEQVVQRSLRETLGAQFTEAEGARLIARAYNPMLPPEKNAARLKSLMMALQSTATQKQGMREYFNQNGTLRGFSGNTNIPSVDDFIRVMDGAAPGPQATPSQGAIDYLRANPSMTAEFDAKYGRGAAATILGGQ